MSSIHNASADPAAFSTTSSSVSERRSSSKLDTSNGLNLYLLVAFLPTIISILYFRWNSLVGVDGDLISTLSNQTRSPRSPALVPTIVPEPQTSLETATRGELYDLYARSCPQHDYQIRIFSYDPYIVYVENFLPSWERKYMLNLAEDHYSRSKVYADDEYTSKLSDGRTSQTAFLPYDPVRDCIMQRAADFQGGIPIANVESLQMVKYDIGNRYKIHYDYHEEDLSKRISTFFVYVACTASSDTIEQAETLPASNTFTSFSSTRCEGGETWFPSLANNTYSSSWCSVVDCENKDGRVGVAFKAKPGNAVFWSNIHPNGTYHPDVDHAGLPVLSGQKVGLNIWTQDMAAPQTKFRNEEEEVNEDEDETKKQDEEFKKAKMQLKMLKDRLKRAREAEEKQEKTVVEGEKST